MKYTAFHEQRFRAQVSQTLKQLQSILDNTRHPRLAEDQDHQYDDKFSLAEFVTNTAIAAEMNALERLGLDPEKLKTICRWVHDEKKTIKIRFQASDGCVLFKEQDVELPVLDVRSTTETTTSSPSDHSRPSLFGGGSKTETRKQQVVTRVKESHWNVSVEYTISVIAGTDQVLELQSRSSSGLIVTSGGQGHPSAGVFKGGKRPMPLPERTVHAPIEADLTWFVKMIDPSEHMCQFGIDRTVDTCKTPRRNDSVDSAVKYHQELYGWAQAVELFFRRRLEKEIMDKHSPVNQNPTTSSNASRLEPGCRGILMGLEQEPTFNGKLVKVLEWSNDTQKYKVEPVDKNSSLPSLLIVKQQNIIPDSSFGPPLSAATADRIFVPIAPVLEEGSVLGMAEVGSFLAEQCRSMDVAIDGLAKIYPPRQLVKLLSIAEATIVVVCQHLSRLVFAYEDGVDYIENMLKQQLVTAIGKEIKAADFDQFMIYHQQKLFVSAYAPSPFVYSIRRQDHDPDGVVVIEMTRQKTLPISTMVRHIAGGDTAPSILMPIDAATCIEITGDRYLHGWMQHQFKSVNKPNFQIVARARQFSCFLLVIGMMMGPSNFEPKDAIIVSNKDEVLIPLMTETLPSAKEFRNSIASLSPEQREFAESFRSMQLASSVFGLCVIQLKPQLEVVLGLPTGSLTKEIQLTQELLSLFVEYQIPSDLMSFDGRDDTEQSIKLETVKGHVKSILKVIDAEKEKQLKEEVRMADMREEMSFARDGDEGEDSDISFQPKRLTGGGRVLDGCMPPTNSEGLPQSFNFGVSPFPSRSLSANVAASGFAPQLAASSRLTPSPADSRPRQSTGSQQDVPAQLPQGLDRGHSLFGNELGDTEGGDDFTIIPKQLDRKIEMFDTDGALRSAVIKASSNWTRRRQANLLTAMKSLPLAGSAIIDEKKKAFDLLDAVTRSGALPIDCAELHVIIGVSHCFENDLMGTVIQDNINPIAKVEMSSLLLASTVFKKHGSQLIRDEEQAKRLKQSFPLLLDDAETEDIGQGTS